MARTAKSKNSGDKASKESFEENLSKLETIVKEMEAGELTLEESLAKFSEGISLSKICLSKINSAQEQIDKILQEEPENGGFVLKPLNFSEGGLDK